MFSNSHRPEYPLHPPSTKGFGLYWPAFPYATLWPVGRSLWKPISPNKILIIFSWASLLIPTASLLVKSLKTWATFLANSSETLGCPPASPAIKIFTPFTSIDLSNQDEILLFETSCPLL